MKKLKIIVDCAPGRDQGIALAYGAANRNNFEFLGVTTVSENGKLREVTDHVLRLETFLKLDVPVAMGMDVPLVREPEEAGFLGDPGFGGAELLGEPAGVPEKEHAVLFLHRVLSGLPKGEKVTVVALASLTNIALLIRLFPEDGKRIREIVFAGGAARGGNITPSAEYHVYADPEAARIVFRSGIPLVMCGLDASLKCTLTRKQILKLCQSGSPAAKLCGELAGFSLENSSDKYRGETSIYGVVPLMYLLHPDIFAIERTILDADCSQGPARGTVLCDFRWWEHEEEELDAFILMDADAGRFQEELIMALYELGETLRN